MTSAPIRPTVALFSCQNNLFAGPGGLGVAPRLGISAVGFKQDAIAPETPPDRTVFGEIRDFTAIGFRVCVLAPAGSSGSVLGRSSAPQYRTPGAVIVVVLEVLGHHRGLLSTTG